LFSNYQQLILPDAQRNIEFLLRMKIIRFGKSLFIFYIRCKIDCDNKPLKSMILFRGLGEARVILLIKIFIL
jgi:hypothetical protein